VGKRESLFYLFTRKNSIPERYCH